jgi:hypothetical protein
MRLESPTTIYFVSKEKNRTRYASRKGILFGIPDVLCSNHCRRANFLMNEFN